MSFLPRIGLGMCLITACMSVLLADDGELSHASLASIETVSETATDELGNTIPAIHITPIAPAHFIPSYISEFSSGEKVKLIEPIQEPIFTRSGRVVLSSVSSYRAIGDGIGKCSLLTRKNLGMLLRNLGSGSHKIFQGDAAELIIFGLHNGTIQAFSDKESMIRTLDERKSTNIETVFDAYRRNTPSIEMVDDDERTRAFYNQAHRAVIFLGDDENWYILDTIDGNKSEKPQLLSEYLPSDFKEREWFIRTPGYSSVDLVSAREFDSILPFLSPELQLWWHGKREFVTQHEFETPIASLVAIARNESEQTLQ